MTFEDLLDILAEQFSCDASDLGEDITFEDLVELAWQLGEAIGLDVSEDSLKTVDTIGALWRLVRELEEEAETL